jgi:hypothetical protein
MQEFGHEKAWLYCGGGDFGLGQRSRSAGAIGRWLGHIGRRIRRNRGRWRYIEPINIDQPLDIRAIRFVAVGHDASTGHSTRPVQLVSVQRDPNITNNAKLAVEHVADDARLTNLEHSR